MMGFIIILTVLFALGMNMILGSAFLGFDYYIQDKVKHNKGFYVSLGMYVCTILGILIFTTVYTNSLPLPSKDTSFSIPLLLFILPFTNPNSHIFSIYPFLPWLPLVLYGVLFARIVMFYQWNHSKQSAIHFGCFIVFLLLFFIFRVGNGFGNIHLELIQPTIFKDVVSFLTLTKYPPSITFCLWNMSWNHLILSMLFLLQPVSKTNFALVFGKSALFFYIMHFWVYFLIKVGMSFFIKENLSLVPFLSVWILGLLILYPMCKRYAQFKSQQSIDSIWRMF
jgi:uncharacterized membrane protein